MGLPKQTNKHGLSRGDLKADVRRQIRQECGFGCITCGLAVYQYEHIDPPFEDALHHDPEAMGLLCGSCHDKVTRGIWSKAKIIDARKNPITFKGGHSQDAFDLQGPLNLWLGSTLFQNVRAVVRMKNGDEWLSIEPPETPEAPYRINAKFYDKDGSLSLEIVANEWKCPTTVWDCEVKGRSLTIRRSLGDVALILEAVPPHGIRIKRLSMMNNQVELSVNAKGVLSIAQNGSELSFDACDIDRADAVIVL